MTKNSRTFITIRLIIFSCVCFMVVWLLFLLTPTISQQDGMKYFLRPGTSKKVLITELHQQGIIKHPWLFSLYALLHSNDGQLKAGEYLFKKGTTPISIWRQMIKGTGMVHHPFTIVPGWSFNQLRNALQQAEGLKHTVQTLSDKQLMTYLGYPELAPEGEFFPDTYYYTLDVADKVILKRAFLLMQKKLNTAWQHRAPALPYQNVYEALIAASLIEKEAYLDVERPIIAGVLVNRFQKEMPLQFDPTVIYGLGDRYDGKIHKENLAEDTPYNTYVHKGLPPTPIAMPGLRSIQAALHPDKNNYLYFVARGDGSHQFSETLVAHHLAVMSANKLPSYFFNEALVRKYLQRLSWLPR